MNHALYGASLPFLVGVLWYLAQGRRASVRFLVLLPLAMGFMALWASAPDLPRVIGMQGLYMRLAQDARMDIFLWHHTLDGLEAKEVWYSFLESDSHWFTAGVVVEGAAVMGIAIRELFKREREHG